MVDNIIESNGELTISTFQIAAGNLFNREGVFMESGIIENIAQTAAAGSSLSKHEIKGSLFYIGAIKELIINRLPIQGEVLTTTIALKVHIMNLSSFEGKVVVGDELIASCELKIALA